MILFTKNNCPACDMVKYAIATDARLPKPMEANIDMNRLNAAHAQQLGIRALPTLFVDGLTFVGANEVLRVLRSRAGLP